MAAATLVGVGIAAAFAGTSLRGRHVAAPRATQVSAEKAETLRDTGFFQLERERIAFSPQYALWSDGATKRRWIYLPPGSSIDASDPDAWQFPIGTRLWKEFSFRGIPVETRYMRLTSGGWQYATYIWNDAGTEAALAPVTGAAAIEIEPGVRHRVPSEADCRACHASSTTAVLAFGTLQLSSDRDPNAPHAEPPMPGSVDLRELVARGLVRHLAPDLVLVPPRIPGPPDERAALGYLHANCGGCHRGNGALATVGMDLSHSVRAPGAALRTTLDRDSAFMAPLDRVEPGDSAHSVIIRRISARTPVEQMPPLGTQLVDEEATRLLARWIDQLAPTVTNRSQP